MCLVIRGARKGKELILICKVRGLHSISLLDFPIQDWGKTPKFDIRQY